MQYFGIGEKRNGENKMVKKTIILIILIMSIGIVSALQVNDGFFYYSDDTSALSSDVVLNMPFLSISSNNTNTIDYSVNNLIGYVYNTTYNSTDNSYLFDGNYSYIEINNTPIIPSFSINSYTGEPRNIFFKPDGLKMYVADSVGNNILHFNLTTAWDITTLVYNGAFPSGMVDPAGLFIKSDGLKFWVLAYGTDYIRQYNMSVAWEMNTSTYENINYSTLTLDTTPLGFTFNNDGTKLYLSGSTTDNIFELNLSTAWDISTLTYTNKKFFNGNFEDGVNQIFINDNGTKMWVHGSVNDVVVEYVLYTPYDITTMTSIGKRLYTGVLDTGATGMFFNPNGSILYTTGTTTDTIYRINLSIPYDLYDYKYGTSSTEVTTVFIKHGRDLGSTTIFTDGIYSVAFNNDGTKVYVLSSATYDMIAQFNLTTPYDIKTTVFDNKEYNVSLIDTLSSAIFFKPDGTTMYLVGRTTDKIYQFNLTTAWDITTLTLTNNVSYTSGGASEAWQLFISPDGLNAYLADNGHNAWFWYSLSQAWNISTLTNITHEHTQILETANIGIYFNSNGTLMFLGGQSHAGVTKYELTTAWNISTAINTEQQISSLWPAMLGLLLTPNGTSLLMWGSGIDSIQQYNLTNAWSFEETNSGYTISSCINPKTIGEVQGIIIDKGFSTVGIYGYSLRMNTVSNRVQFYDSNGNTPTYSDVNSVPFNSWTSIIVTKNANGKTKIYTNGNKSSYDFILPPNYMITNDYLIKTRIGNRANNIDRTFNGSIGRTILMNRTVTDAEAYKISRTCTNLNYPYFGSKDYLYTLISTPNLRCDRSGCVVI